MVRNFLYCLLMLINSSCLPGNTIRCFENGHEVTVKKAQLFAICRSSKQVTPIKKTKDFSQILNDINRCESVLLVVQRQDDYVLIENFKENNPMDSLIISWYDYESVIEAYPFLSKAPIFECAVTYSDNMSGLMLPNETFRLVENTDSFSEYVRSNYLNSSSSVSQ